MATYSYLLIWPTWAFLLIIRRPWQGRQPPKLLDAGQKESSTKPKASVEPKPELVGIPYMACVKILMFLRASKVPSL